MLSITHDQEQINNKHHYEVVLNIDIIIGRICDHLKYGDYPTSI